jgi:hypothetical protein
VGNFAVTNLRVIWYAQKDRDINLSIGLDTVNNVFMKSFPMAMQRLYEQANGFGIEITHRDGIYPPKG